MSLAGRCVQFYRPHPGVPRISRSGDGGEGGGRGRGGTGRGWREKRANMNSDNVLLVIGNATIISKAEVSTYDNIVIS